MQRQRPEPELLEHLVIEFGDHGQRAVGFLVTAQNLLEADRLDSPRLGETIAYCLREAMKAIPSSFDTGDSGRWKKLSREVVDAYRRFKIATSLPEGRDNIWNELDRQIDDLERFHDQPGLYEKQLLAVMSRRTGVVPLSAGTTPVRTYQNLLDRLNKALHGECSVADSRQLWYACLNILRQFFLPPEIKQSELESLAQIESPSTSDMDDVLALVATPDQLRYFLRRISSPTWLRLLEPSGVLDPSDSLDKPWPAHVAAVQLAANYSTEILAWLDEMYDKHGSNSTRALYLAKAALDVGESGFGVVRRAITRHPTTPLLLELGIRAIDKVNSSDQLVEEFADVLLNESSWEFGAIVWWLKDHPMEQFADGVNEGNAKNRVVLLCQKIRSISGENHSMRRLAWNVSGSIADQNDLPYPDRFTDLLSWLVVTLKKAWEFIPPVGILSLKEFQSLPSKNLIQRLRTWILGNAPNVEPDLLIEEIERAITYRDPTGDDLAVIDRVLKDCEPSSYVSRWHEALGPAPYVRQVGAALSTGDIPAEWLRVHQWVSLCPPGVAGLWSTPCDILSAEYGRNIRESLESHIHSESYFVGSPLSADDLRADEPEQVAVRIADWRPEPTDRRVGFYQLAQTLESVVKEDIERWVFNPIRIVTRLRHPIYICHYLRGIAKDVSDNELPTEALLDVITLVRTHPWPVIELDSHSQKVDWRETEYAAVDLIKALTQAGVNFGDRADEVWDFLETEALDRSEISRFPCDQGYDPLYLAINRPCTRALETIILFTVSEFRSSGTVRSELTDLLETSLRLTGHDGAEHRAIIAPRIGLIRHILPDWTEEHRQLLFGAEAPEDLGQITVDLALRWGQPDRWLLESHSEMIRNSVEREVDRALNVLLLAMFWGIMGYSVEDNITFLQRLSDHSSLPKVGGNISQLLGEDEVDPLHLEIAADFWKALLEKKLIDILKGFGWMADVEAMEFELWADLTLRTLKVVDGRMTHAHRVAEKVMSSPPTKPGLEIINWLVRGEIEEWDRLLIIDGIKKFLPSAEVLKETDEYKRLHTTLIERGVIDTRMG